MKILETNAISKICPFMSHKTLPQPTEYNPTPYPFIGYCQASACMAWKRDKDDVTCGQCIILAQNPSYSMFSS